MHAHDRLRSLDHELTRRVAAADPPWAARGLAAIEWAAQGTKVWWVGAAALTWSGRPGERPAAARGVAGMLCAQVGANAIAKHLYRRPRPPAELIPHDDPTDRPDSSSFPSGHTAAAVGFAASAAPASPAWGAAAAVLASLIGLQRVTSGAHYVSDVAAGAAIGLASAVVVHRTARLLPRLPGRCGSDRRRPAAHG